MVKGQGSQRRGKSIRRISLAKLPAGFRAIALYSIIVGLCYLFALFIGIYNPDMLVLAQLQSSTVWAFNIAIAVLIGAMVIGIAGRRRWAYPIALIWFLVSILLSLFSLFMIDTGALPAMRYLLWALAIAVIAIDLIILWYLTNRKQYLLQPSLALSAFRGERKFVRILSGCWITIILISAALGLNFYRQTTAVADQSIDELSDTTIIHGIVLCDTKEGQERDICYVVLATMHPEQDLNAICSRIQSEFFRFTCFRTERPS